MFESIFYIFMEASQLWSCIISQFVNEYRIIKYWRKVLYRWKGNLCPEPCRNRRTNDSPKNINILVCIANYFAKYL